MGEPAAVIDGDVLAGVAEAIARGVWILGICWNF